MSASPYCRIEIVKTEDKQEIIDLLRKFFIRDEPLNQSVGLINENNPTCPELEKYSLKNFDHGLSIKAVVDGKIIAVCLNHIIHKDQKQEPSQISDKNFAKVVGLLEYVVQNCNVFGHYPDIDKYMDINVLSVDSAFRGQGIAQTLIAKTREIAKEQGCPLMSVSCSSYFTAKAVKKLGFECIYELEYKNYKVNGEVVFTPALPHTGYLVYGQRL